MKSIGNFVVVVFVLAMVMYSGVVYAGTSGIFRLPYDENQRWKYANGTDCPYVGFWNDPPDHGQDFMNLYSVSRRYHLAEDWNGKCGGSTDFGAVLYAIADGFVEKLDDTGVANGGWLLIKHPLPDGTNRYVLYEHI